MGERLRQLRKERGWTLEDVVEQLHRLAREIGEPVPGVDRQAVSRWERGTHRPRPYYVRLLSRLFEASPSQLGLVDGAAEQGSVIHQAAAALRMSGDPGVPSLRIDAIFQMAERDAVAELERRIKKASAELDTVPPLVQVQDVAMVLRSAEDLAAGASAPATVALKQVMCNAAVILGWLNYNMHNRGYASSFWTTARDRAKDLGNDQLYAYILGCRSCLYSGVPKRGGDRYDSTTPIVMLDHAIDISKGTANPTLRAYLYGRRGEEHAAAGHGKEAARDLTAGHSVLGRSVQVDDSVIPILSDWKDARLARYHGSAAQLLGDYREAGRTLRVALEDLKPEFLPQRAMIMTDLGAVCAEQSKPDVDCAVALLHAALDIAHQAGLGEAEMRVVEARKYLTRWTDLPWSAGWTSG